MATINFDKITCSNTDAAEEVSLWYDGTPAESNPIWGPFQMNSSPETLAITLPYPDPNSLDTPEVIFFASNTNRAIPLDRSSTSIGCDISGVTYTLFYRVV